MAKLRRKGKTRSAALMLICCEGAETEIQYFGAWAQEYPRVKVSIFSPPNNASAPSHLVDEIKSKMREHRFEAGDQAWLVLDEDRWQGKQRSNLHQQIKSAKLQEVRSNPCFELWLLAHFEPIGTPLKKAQAVARLRHNLGGFNSANLNMPAFLTRVNLAVANAQAVDTNQGVQPGVTRVYRLMHAIAELIAPARLDGQA